MIPGVSLIEQCLATSNLAGTVRSILFGNEDACVSRLRAGSGLVDRSVDWAARRFIFTRLSE